MNFLEKYKRIVFVDEDNTGLAAFAAALLRKKLTESKVADLLVESRGSVVLFQEPLNPKVNDIALEYGLNLGRHTAKQLAREDFAPDTLILTLDPASNRRVHLDFESAVNVFPMKEYIGTTGEILLPIGGDVEKYRAVCESVDKLLDKLVDVRILDGQDEE